MWTRAELKNNAKLVLKRNYWLALAVTVVYSVIGGSFSGMASGFSSGLNSATASGIMDTQAGRELMLILAIVAMVVGVVSILAAIFLVGPLQVGLYRFFMENRENSMADFMLLFWGFRGGRYWHNVKVMALMLVKVLLWTLLLIVPGIIKQYEYAMIPFLLAENPDKETDWYFRVSRGMMSGEKWNFFVLGLSFIGWTLLGMLACCIGIYFVQPYIFATYAEFYALMRAKAFATGIAVPDELPGFAPQPYRM